MSLGTTSIGSTSSGTLSSGKVPSGAPVAARSQVRQFWALWGAMLRLELRARDSLVLLVSQAILLAVVTSFGLTSVLLDSETRARLFPALVWICFVLNAAVSLGRSFEYEIEHRAIDGLLLAGVSPASVFFAKAGTNFLILFIAHVVGVTALGMAVGVTVLPVVTGFLELSALVLFAYASMATLAAGIVSQARLKSLLLPLILLPLLLPLFFCAVELSAGLMKAGALDFQSWWASLLIGLDVLYLALGAGLFEFVVGEH